MAGTHILIMNERRKTDKEWMSVAISEAAKAESVDEVPIGAAVEVIFETTPATGQKVPEWRLVS